MLILMMINIKRKGVRFLFYFKEVWWNGVEYFNIGISVSMRVGIVLGVFLV